MFDNIPLKNGGTVPSNLPVGEPEDMFGDSDSTQSRLAPEPGEQAVPTALSAGVLRPKNDLEEPDQPVGAQAVPPAESRQEDSAEKTLFRTPATPMNPLPPVNQVDMTEGASVAHMLMVAVLVLGVIGVFGGGGWWAYQRFYASREGATEPADTTVPNTPPTNNSSQTSNNAPAGSATSDPLLFGADSDADGLDDVREQSIGTDSRNWDTDSDGLSDYNEIVVWKTDPKNTDTDRDGFVDGEEVNNGYNPAGPGKIFQPPSTTSAVVE